MADRVLNFDSPGTRYEIGNHRVYTRPSWGSSFVGQGFEWSLQDDLHCLECVWSLAPAMPTAMVSYTYGTQTIGSVGGGVFVRKLKDGVRALLGHYIKIEVDVRRAADGQWQSRTWYGVIDSIDDLQDGEKDNTQQIVARGELRLTCYGMEKLLADHAVLHSWISEPAVNPIEIKHAVAFNLVGGKKGITGNRSENADGDNVYVFAGRPNEDKGTWTSKTIVDYLLKYQAPLDRLGQKKVPFELGAAGQNGVNPDGVPPDWDDPQLEAHNGTTYSLLSQIIDRRRLMVWWIEVREATDAQENDVCVVMINTLTDLPIAVNLPDADPIGANTDQVDLFKTARGPLTSVGIRESELIKYDEVVVRGPRRRHVGSFSYADNTLENGWDTGAETDYEAGASGAADYAGQGRGEKQKRNAQARGKDELRDVFALFRIPDTWDFQTADGIGGAKAPMFLDDVGAIDHQHLCGQWIEQTLPLLTATRYTGDIIKNGTINSDANKDGEEMRPLVFFKRPDRSAKDVADGRAQRWIKAEDVGRGANVERGGVGAEKDKANERFSLTVDVPPKSLAIYVKVSGQPQHVIAKTDFAPLADDPSFGHFDYNNAQGMVITISLVSHQYAEARWPDPLPAGTDETLRTKVIYAGDQYKKDYVAPNTVVGINPDDGQLQTSSGGYIPKEGANDNIAKLKAIATLAARWYTEQHYVVAIRSFGLALKDDLQVGDWIERVGHDDGNDQQQPPQPRPATEQGHNQVVKTIVSEIRFSIPRGDGNQTPEPVMSVTTWAGELDSVGISPFVPGRPRRPGLPDRAAPPQPFLGDLMEIGPDGVGRLRPGTEGEAKRRTEELRNSQMGQLLQGEQPQGQPLGGADRPLVEQGPRQADRPLPRQDGGRNRRRRRGRGPNETGPMRGDDQ